MKKKTRRKASGLRELSNSSKTRRYLLKPIHPSRENPKRYRAEREWLFNRMHNCNWCGRGINSRTGELDHIRPVKIYPKLRWHRPNYQALCKTCHKTKTEQDVKHMRKRGIKLPKFL